MTDIEMLNAENARLTKLVIELRAEAVRLNAQAQQPLTDEKEALALLDAENARLMKLVIELRAEVMRLNARATSMQWPKPEDVTPEMLSAFRSAYKEGDFWRARIHGALCAMLSAAPAAPQPAQPLTDEQINEGRQALPYDIEDKPEPWAFKEGVRFAEQAHEIGVKND